ncbi:unnamed protein product [Phytophthora fragariaefolia]|uniref:Unnamed protein product n=1 Tax=Phytophthora fragariaefolia TaxID=1490495 RepID=A0A9W6YAE8_9STRA|nr:unnamed protein product [Phytophthora fragariaefolia]
MQPSRSVTRNWSCRVEKYLSSNSFRSTAHRFPTTRIDSHSSDVTVTTLPTTPVELVCHPSSASIPNGTVRHHPWCCTGWGPKYKKEQARPPPAAGTAHRAVTRALHDEILEYAEYTRATVDMMAMHIEQMIANVRASVLTLRLQAQVEMFGSYSSGIWLPSSDVDLVILDGAGVSDSQMTAEHLKELAKVQLHSAWAFFLKFRLPQI